MPTWEQISLFWNGLTSGSLPDFGIWSYVLIALLVFVEGPAVTLVAATLAATGVLRADLVFVASVIGNFMADSFWYLLGYLGGDRRVLLRFRWVRKRWREIQRIQGEVRGRATRMFLITKLSLGLLTIPVLIASGLARVPWWRLVIVSIIVEPIWNGFLVLAGYRLGDQVLAMDRGLRIAAIIAAVVVLIAFIAVYRRVVTRLLRITL
ncbi:MAG: VTT domain-containing protein [Anaerolineales bacterium]|nr:VTT domain-containing protein [Anaerolineales bacterium]